MQLKERVRKRDKGESDEQSQTREIYFEVRATCSTPLPSPREGFLL